MLFLPLDFYICYSHCLEFNSTPVQDSVWVSLLWETPTWLTKTNLPTLYYHSTEYVSFEALSTVVTLMLGILLDVCPFPRVAPLMLRLRLLSRTIVLRPPAWCLTLGRYPNTFEVNGSTRFPVELSTLVLSWRPLSSQFHPSFLQLFTSADSSLGDSSKLFAQMFSGLLTSLSLPWA